MPMTLVFKRSKNFVQSDDNGTKKFLAQANPSAPIPVPFWVYDTPTFKQGIKDGSIVNLTPPAQMPGYRVPKHAESEEAPEAASAEPDPTKEKTEAELKDEEDAAEQTEIPKPAFGAQPMTPVAPAPKVGGITGNSKKAK